MNGWTKCGIFMDRILFSHSKDWETDTCYNVDELWKCYFKWKKTDKRSQYSDSIYMKHQQRSVHRTRHQASGSQRRGGGALWGVVRGIGCDCLTTIEFLSGDENVLELDRVDCYTTLWIVYFKMVNFSYVNFTSTFKKSLVLVIILLLTSCETWPSHLTFLGLDVLLGERGVWFLI